MIHYSQQAYEDGYDFSSLTLPEQIATQTLYTNKEDMWKKAVCADALIIILIMLIGMLLLLPFLRVIGILKIVAITMLLFLDVLNPRKQVQMITSYHC